MGERLRIVLVIAAAFILSACQEDGPSASVGAEPIPDLFALQRLACEDDGGRWGPAGGSSTFVCFRETRDANQQCRKASDCDGLCLARSRTCSPIEPFLGCHEILTEGGVPATQCIN